MRLPIRQLFIALTGLITFIPLLALTDWVIFSTVKYTPVALPILQCFSAITLYFCFKKNISRSFKLFWRYLLLAIIAVLIGKLINFIPFDIEQQLYQDFITLSIYFFVLLALETNPHLSDVPLNKYVSGRIPAISYTLVCFCYFVLLPAEFDHDTYIAGKPSLLFELLINGLIVVKLVWCLLATKQQFWRSTFALLLCSSFCLLFGNIGAITHDELNAVYLTTEFPKFMALLAYFFLILSANITLKENNFPKASMKESNSELYILLLMFVPTAMHLYGAEQQTFYSINSSLQSITILFWLVLGSSLISHIALNRRSKNDQLKENIGAAKNKNERLNVINHQLRDALTNSEFKAIVNASNNAILTTSITGEVLSANPAAVQMFQSLEQELIGISVSTLFAEKDEMHYFFDFQSNIYSLQRKELGISVECLSLRSDGTEFPAQAELQWAERAEQPLIVITFISMPRMKGVLRRLGIKLSALHQQCRSNHLKWSFWMKLIFLLLLRKLR